MKSSTAIVLILISVGLYYTFTMNEWGKTDALKAQASSYKQVLDNVCSLRMKRDQLLDRYKAIPQTQLDQLEKILPNNVDTVTLALDLDSMASKYGISIKSVSTSTTDPNPSLNTGAIATDQTAPTMPYQIVYVNLQFTSNYDNFRKFLGDIEKSLRVIDPRSVSFKVGQSTTGSNLYDYNISIQTYWTK